MANRPVQLPADEADNEQIRWFSSIEQAARRMRHTPSERGRYRGLQISTFSLVTGVPRCDQEPAPRATSPGHCPTLMSSQRRPPGVGGVIPRSTHAQGTLRIMSDIPKQHQLAADSKVNHPHLLLFNCLSSSGRGPGKHGCMFTKHRLPPQVLLSYSMIPWLLIF